MSEDLAALLAAIVTLVAFGFISIGFYASVGGLAIAITTAVLVGIGTRAIVGRSRR